MGRATYALADGVLYGWGDNDGGAFVCDQSGQPHLETHGVGLWGPQVSS